MKTKVTNKNNSSDQRKLMPKTIKEINQRNRNLIKDGLNIEDPEKNNNKPNNVATINLVANNNVFRQPIGFTHSRVSGGSSMTQKTEITTVFGNDAVTMYTGSTRQKSSVITSPPLMQLRSYQQLPAPYNNIPTKQLSISAVTNALNPDKNNNISLEIDRSSVPNLAGQMANYKIDTYLNSAHSYMSNAATTTAGAAAEAFGSSFQNTKCSNKERIHNSTEFVYSRQSTTVICNYCKTRTTTILKFKFGYGCCISCCLLNFISCNFKSSNSKCPFVNCFADDYKDVFHYCAGCDREIGKCEFLG